MKKIYIQVCVNLQICRKLRCFFGKIYTADENFTRPLVATVATNSKSAMTQTVIVTMIAVMCMKSTPEEPDETKQLGKDGDGRDNNNDDDDDNGY